MVAVVFEIGRIGGDMWWRKWLLTLCLFVGLENLGIGKQRKREEEKVGVLIKHYTCFLRGAYKSSLRDSIFRWSPRGKNATSNVINP